MAKEYFDQHRIAYTDINVELDDAAAAEMIRKSGQMGVPVIFVGDEMIIGFDQERLVSTLGITA